MSERIIFAGFGGQGMLLAGKLLCIAAMREGKHVSHIPSYGAEMRGGTANCSVVVSDEEIASPVVREPSICVVMNQPSLLKFEPRVQKGGLLIYNSALIDAAPQRDDIRCVEVRANDLAEKEGSFRAANMIALGVLLQLKPETASLDQVIQSLPEVVSARNRDLLEINVRCLKRGFTLELGSA